MHRSIIVVMLAMLVMASSGQAGERTKTYPQPVRVTPSKASSNNKYIPLIVASIASKLEGLGFEVVGRGVEWDLAGPLMAAGVKLNDATQLAMASEGELLLAFEIFRERGKKPEQRKVIMNLKMLNPGTGRILGMAIGKSQAVTTDDKPGWAKAVVQACDQASDNILNQIRSALDQPPVRGDHYMLVFDKPPKKLDMRLHRALKKAVDHSGAVIAMKDLVVFHVHATKNRAGLKKIVDEALGKYPSWPAATVSELGKQTLLYRFAP